MFFLDLTQTEVHAQVWATCPDMGLVQQPAAQIPIFTQISFELKWVKFID